MTIAIGVRIGDPLDVSVGIPVAWEVDYQWEQIGFTIDGDPVYCDNDCADCTLYVNGEVFDPLEDFVFTPDPTLTEEQNDELEDKLQMEHWDTKIY